MIADKFIPDIQKLESKYNIPNLKQDIQSALKNSKAFLHSHEDMIFVLKAMLIDNKKILFAWVGVHHKHTSLKDDIRELEAIAKATGFDCIRFETKRKGFLRYAPKFGYQHIGKRLDYDIYNKEV